MSETPSAMIPIGSSMPSISLLDPLGVPWSQSQKKSGFLVVFMCNHCPFVLHVAQTLNTIAMRCEAAGIEMVGINSNDANAYPADSPEKMLETAEEFGWAFPYLVDETQEAAAAFQATCTPDVFLYDNHQKLYYRGQFDDSRPRNGISCGSDLLGAIDSLLGDNPPPENQKPAIGCNIKWKP